VTPTDELRTAAEKLRADAEAAHRASPAPWTVTDEHVVRCADGMIVADRSSTDHPAERADLPYIATMHPGVGKALTELLDAAADMAGAYPEMAHDHDRPACDDYACDVMGRSIALARTLNRSQP
jgi:hypothetical protein